MLKTFADVLDIYNGKNQRKVENPNGQYPIYGSGGIMGYADDFICPAQTVLIGRKGSINSPIFAESPLWNVDTVFGLIAKDGVILPKYLYYFCVHFDFEKLNTTVTIPSLTKANLLKISMPVPTITEQKAITGILDKLQSIITHRKQQLEKLDELVKARFVEMFGEVGTDPMGFGVRCLIEVCEINPKKTDDKRLYSSLEVSFVPMPAVTENGSIDPSETRTYDEVKTGFTYFSERDVLFAKITPCMENGKGAVAVGLCNRIGFGSTEFHVLRPIADVSNPYWLYTITSFERFRREAARKMTGSAGQRRVPARFLEQYEVAVPPIALQNQFESFVSQIDKSKVAVQKALDEAQLLFDSLMQEYFG